MAVGSTARKYHTQQVHYLVKEYAYSDLTSGTAETLGTVPAGAVIIDAGVVVETAFNSATSDLLDIGTSGDGNGFASAISVATAGRIVADDMATSDDLTPSSDTDITFEWTGSGTAPSAGVIHPYVTYLVPNVS